MEAFFGFSQGKRACFYATTAYVADSPVLIELVCEKGSIRLEGETVTVVYAQGGEAVFRLIAGEATGKLYWGSGHAACIGDFYRSLEEKTPYANDLASVSVTLRVMMRMYQSAGMRPQEYER